MTYLSWKICAKQPRTERQPTWIQLCLLCFSNLRFLRSLVFHKCITYFDYVQFFLHLIIACSALDYHFQPPPQKPFIFAFITFIMQSFQTFRQSYSGIFHRSWKHNKQTQEQTCMYLLMNQCIMNDVFLVFNRQLNIFSTSVLLNF